MSEYTPQETKFLERLGFTPGPWHHDTDGKLYIKKNDGGCEWIGEVLINNGDFIAQSPDLLLALFTSLLTFQDFCTNKQRGVSAKISRDYFLDNNGILESATGKTWKELCQIWDECKGKGDCQECRLYYCCTLDCCDEIGPCDYWEARK